MQTLKQILPDNQNWLQQKPRSKLEDITILEVVRSPATVTTDALETATRLAASLLSEIGKRWPGQAKWAGDPEVAVAWGRGMLETGNTDSRRLKAALARLTARPYPPDLGSLLDEAKSAGISDADAQRSLQRVYSSLSAGDLSILSQQELYAIRRWPGGSWELRTAPGGEVTERRWKSLLADAMAADPASLPVVPPKPEGLLVKKIDKEVAARGIAKLRAVLAKGNES